MTTKKQRREQVAAKREEFNAEMRRIGLEAQRLDQLRRQQRLNEIERIEQSKKRAIAARKVAEGKEPMDAGDLIRSLGDSA